MHALLTLSLLFLASATHDNSKEGTYSNIINTLFDALVQTTIVAGPQTNKMACVGPVKSLLSDDVVVFVIDVGNFSGVSLASEYFCIPSIRLVGNSQIISFTRVDIIYVENESLWASWSFQAAERLPNPSCANDSFEAVLSPVTFTVDILGKLTFDDEDKINYLEAYLNFNTLLAYESGYDPSNETEVLTQFCYLDFLACGSTGTDLGDVTQGITGFIAECTQRVGYELATNPSFAGIGSPYFFTNTFACREAHLPMAFIDPVMHCPHVNIQSTACTMTQYILNEFRIHKDIDRVEGNASDYD